MKNSFLFLLLVLSISTIKSQTTIWTGASSTNWHDASNWTAGIPDYSLQAQMNLSAIVDVYTSAQAKSVVNAGQIEIHSSGALDIQGASNFGFRNSGVLLNSGTISIKGVGNDGLFNDPMGQVKQLNGAQLIIGDPILFVLGNGIENYGSIDNQTGASILIQNLSESGLFNVDGDILNIGTLSIKKIASNGLYNTGTLTNFGLVSIDQIMLVGLLNGGEIYNSAQCIIEHINSVGLMNGIDSSGVFKDGLFINDFGMVEVKNTASYGILNERGEFLNQMQISIFDQIKNIALVNKAHFVNDSLAHLAIHRVDSHGILNVDSLINKGTMTLDTILRAGIVNGITSEPGYLINQRGSISLTNYSRQGLLNTNGKCFNNAMLHISGPSGYNALENSAFFENASIGSLAIDSAGMNGLVNFGKFYSLGDVNILAADSVGLINGDTMAADPSLFINQLGTILIVDCGDEGVLNNHGKLINNGILNVRDQLTSDGIINQDTFCNDVNAHLEVRNSGINGIYNVGVFNNYSRMIIDSSQLYGIHNGSEVDHALFQSFNDTITVSNGFGTGIINYFSILIHDSATLMITDLLATGIYNREYFQNDGAIEINAMGSYGVVNGKYFPADFATFVNSSGSLSINDIGVYGILNDRGTIYNSDRIIMKAVHGDFGLLNRDTFFNSETAKMTIEGASNEGFRNYNYAYNAGTMMFTDTFDHAAINNNSKFYNTETGEILIKSMSSYGVVHAGRIYNDGLFDIDGHCTNAGILCFDQFHNSVTGQVLIRQSDHAGMDIAYEPTTLFNNGYISIIDVDALGIILRSGASIQNFNEILIQSCSTAVVTNGGGANNFHNHLGALLDIDSVSRQGMRFNGISTLSNEGDITIQGADAYLGIAIVGGATGLNASSGQILIHDIGGEALRVVNIGSHMSNYGLIHAIITSGPWLLIDLEGEFFNALDAELIIDSE